MEFRWEMFAERLKKHFNVDPDSHVSLNYFKDLKGRLAILGRPEIKTSLVALLSTLSSENSVFL
jgi:hypothetical protein